MNMKSLKDIRLKNTGKIVIGPLNIDSIGQKFNSLKEITTGNIDMFTISETKLDESWLDEGMRSDEKIRRSIYNKSTS